MKPAHLRVDGAQLVGLKCCTPCLKVGQLKLGIVVDGNSARRGKFVLSQGEGAAAEAYRGVRIQVDEAKAADVHKKAGVVEKVGPAERALDLGDEEIPDVGRLAEGEGDMLLVEGLVQRPVGSD